MVGDSHGRIVDCIDDLDGIDISVYQDATLIRIYTNGIERTLDPGQARRLAQAIAQAGLLASMIEVQLLNEHGNE